MGLLDWLSEAVGGSDMNSSGTPMMPGPGATMGEYNPMGDATGGSMPKPTPATMPIRPPMPPVQMTGQDSPPLPPSGPTPETAFGQGPPPGPAPLPPTGDPMQAAAGYGGPGPGLPPAPPTPPGRMTANAAPPMPPGGVNAPMVLDSYRRAGGTMMDPGRPDMGPAQARSIIGRALGLNPNQENTLRGSLGAGLKAAGENSNKGKGAAFMGSAGSAIEGGKGADDKTTDQQDKVLGRAIQSKTADQAAINAGTTNRLNEARTKLAEEQTKMASAGGKDSVMNSQQQLYLRAMGLVNNDPEVKLAKSAYDNALKVGDPNSAEVKAAKKAHEDLVKAKTAAHLGNLGVDPKIAEKIGQQPGMSQDNPVDTKGFTQQKLNDLPGGSYIRTPDGKVLQKKMGQPQAAGANQAAPSQSMTPAVQPPIPPAVANARAQMGADDEED